MRVEVVNIFRYVDDFPVNFSDNGANSIVNVESLFHECGEVLNIVKAVREQDMIQFQGLSVKFGDGDICW